MTKHPCSPTQGADVAPPYPTQHLPWTRLQTSRFSLWLDGQLELLELRFEDLQTPRTTAASIFADRSAQRDGANQE